MALIKYHAVALELVCEHPQLTESGSRQQPRQRTNTMVGHRTLPPSLPWAGRDGEGRSGGQGRRRASEGRQSTFPAQGSPFHPTIPRLVCCNDFKDATKASCPSSTESTGVAVLNATGQV
jgi:hypothetical protein